MEFRNPEESLVRIRAAKPVSYDALAGIITGQWKILDVEWTAAPEGK